MQPWDRADAVYNLELLQRFGPDMLAPEQLAAAQGIAPQTVAKILEQRGRQTGEFQRLQQLAPADFAGDPNDLRTRASELRDQQVKQQLELERVMAEGAAEAGEKMGAAVVDAMQQVVDMAIKTIRTRLLQAKNASS
jgi:hypothetical protein